MITVLCVPLIYYAMCINAHSHANKPDGYPMPCYFDLWQVLVSALASMMLCDTIHLYFYPSLYKRSKVMDDEELRVKYARKACDTIYSSIHSCIIVGTQIRKEETCNL